MLRTRPDLASVIGLMTVRFRIPLIVGVDGGSIFASGSGSISSPLFLIVAVSVAVTVAYVGGVLGGSASLF